MITILLSGAVVLLVGAVLYLAWRVRRNDRDISRILETLAAASPVLARRVVERGTQVKLPEQWLEDDLFEEEAVE